MPITLRPARHGDAPTIVEFNRLLALETEDKILDLAVLSAGVDALLRDPDKGSYYIAEQDSIILGQIMFTREWSDWRNGWFWWIQSVYVRAEARRQGVFRCLYRHVHSLAQADGAVIGLRLYVENENHRAQQTYQSLGMNRMDYLMLQRFPL